VAASRDDEVPRCPVACGGLNSSLRRPRRMQATRWGEGLLGGVLTKTYKVNDDFVQLAVEPLGAAGGGGGVHPDDVVERSCWTRGGVEYFSFLDCLECLFYGSTRTGGGGGGRGWVVGTERERDETMECS